jgi:hypothetical protein
MPQVDEKIKRKSYLDTAHPRLVLSIFLMLFRQATHRFHVTLKMIFTILFTSLSSKNQKDKSLRFFTTYI